MTTLLDRVRELDPQEGGKQSSNDEADLAVAWMNGQVRTKACQRVMGMKSAASFAYWAVGVLREGVREGLITVARK